MKPTIKLFGFDFEKVHVLSGGKIYKAYKSTKNGMQVILDAVLVDKGLINQKYIENEFEIAKSII